MQSHLMDYQYPQLSLGYGLPLHLQQGKQLLQRQWVVGGVCEHGTLTVTLTGPTDSQLG